MYINQSGTQTSQLSEGDLIISRKPEKPLKKHNIKRKSCRSQINPDTDHSS